MKKPIHATRTKTKENTQHINHHKTLPGNQRLPLLANFSERFMVTKKTHNGKGNTFHRRTVPLSLSCPSSPTLSPLNAFFGALHSARGGRRDASKAQVEPQFLFSGCPRQRWAARETGFDQFPCK